MEATKFKEECLNIDCDIIVQKYLIDGDSYFFEKYHNKDEEFKFKKELASSLGVHIRDIAIIGSGKLGYSLKPDKYEAGLYLFKEFDYSYIKDGGVKSDLDVAIISSELFDKQLVSIFEHTNCYSNMEYNKNGTRNSFGKLVLKGRLSTKYIPEGYVVSSNISKAQDYFTNKYKRDVNYEIYKSWYFFEKYHINNVKNIQLNLMATN